MYLRYQDTCSDLTFEINSSAVIKNRFTCCGVYPWELTQNTLMLNDASIFCAGIYSERQGDGRFAVVFGQYLDRDWVHLINNPPRKFERIASHGARPCPEVPSPLTCLLEVTTVTVSTIFLYQLESCGLTASCGRDPRLVFWFPLWLSMENI